MEFSSTHRPIPSPLVLHRTIAVKAVAYSPLPRKSPRNDLRTSYAVHFGKIGFVSRVYGESMSNISVIWTRHRTLLPSIASKGEAELNSGIAGAGMVAAAAVTVILAVANRVLYKLALVPMRQYPFFLAQVTTFGYVAVYFAILSARCSFGIVTREMLAIPKFFFVVIGLLEALGVACGMSAGAILPGPAIPILSQTFLEFVFIDGAKRLQGKSLDIFVVNSFGSGFQALFVFLLLPLLSNLRGIPFTELPQYLKNGAACFLNIRGSMADCEGAPFLPLLFILTNMAFNISLLNLIKMSSALLSSLAATLAVPLSIYILSLPLPYIPEGTNLNAFFIIGTVILVSGLALYNLPKPANQSHRND